MLLSEAKSILKNKGYKLIKESVGVLNDLPDSWEWYEFVDCGENWSDYVGELWDEENWTKQQKINNTRFEKFWDDCQKEIRKLGYTIYDDGHAGCGFYKSEDDTFSYRVGIGYDTEKNNFYIYIWGQDPENGIDADGSFVYTDQPEQIKLVIKKINNKYGI